MEIILPYKYQPRSYQLPLLRALDNGVERAFCLWHRRSGKDITLWNLTIKKAFERRGVYFYLLPTFTQARRIIWDGITNDGTKFLDYLPKEIVSSKNATEMKIQLVNGSIIQLIGTDNYDSIRGTNPIGCVFSEYAYQNPAVWEIVKPILTLNKGWAVFNTTPQGHNHAHELFSVAEKNDNWFSEKLSILDTNLLTEEDMELERSEGMTEDMIQQEYFVSFEAAIKGAYYADEIKRIRDENRICRSVYDKDLPTYCSLDIGLKDDVAIIWFQLHGKEVRVIDSYSASGHTVPEYVTVLRSRPYKPEIAFLPWDARIRALTDGKSTIDVMKEHGVNVKVVPNISVQDGIMQTRKILSRCWFEKDKTEELINALSEYKRTYDDKRKVFSKTPLHSWASHFCDSARYMALAIKEQQPDDSNDEDDVAQFMKPKTTFISAKQPYKTPIEFQDEEKAMRAMLDG